MQSAVNARKEGDENINSNVGARMVKLLERSFQGTQNMHRYRNTLPKYLSDKKIHAALKRKYKGDWVIETNRSTIKSLGSPKLNTKNQKLSVSFSCNMKN